MLGNLWRDSARGTNFFPHVLRTSVADLHVCRLHAYGFIDSFTNSLNPTIEGLQIKVKRWINAEIAHSQGPTAEMKGKSHALFTARPGGRARARARPAGVLVRPPGGRARAQAPFTARQPGGCAHVRAPARRACACASSLHRPPARRLCACACARTAGARVRKLPLVASMAHLNTPPYSRNPLAPSGRLIPAPKAADAQDDVRPPCLLDAFGTYPVMYIL